MVGFRPASHGRQQIVADRPHVQFVHLAARRRSQQGHQPVVGQPHFLAGVEVEIVHLGFDPGPSSRHGLVQQLLGGDQMVVDRIAQVRQIDARRTRRASSRNCTGPGTARGAPSTCSSPSIPSRSASSSRRLTIIMRLYISFASGYLTLKFRQKPPRTKGRMLRPARIVLQLVHGILVGQLLVDRQGPLGHFAIAAVGQVDLADRRHMVHGFGQASSSSSQSRFATKASKKRAQPADRGSSGDWSPAKCRTSHRRRRTRPPRWDAARPGRASSRWSLAGRGRGSSTATARCRERSSACGHRPR